MMHVCSDLVSTRMDRDLDCIGSPWATPDCTGVPWIDLCYINIISTFIVIVIIMLLLCYHYFIIIIIIIIIILTLDCSGLPLIGLDCTGLPRITPDCSGESGDATTTQMRITTAA